MTEYKNRVFYFDQLRIIASFAVMMLHISAGNWYSTDIYSFEWRTFNAYDSAVRWCVPIFVMISGALFLDNRRPVSIKDLYCKNIFKLMIAFVFWSLIYAAEGFLRGAPLKTAILAFIQGNYHMWFIFMIAGLYIVVPILRKLTESKRMTEYFLVTGIIMSFMIPRLISFFSILEIPHTTSLLNALNSAFSNINFRLTGGYVCYFVLGYYIAVTDIKKSIRNWVYISGILSYPIIVFLSLWYSEKLNKASGYFYDYFCINVFIMAAAIFVFAKYELSKIEYSAKMKNHILKMSQYSLGAYLVHDLFIKIFRHYLGINTLSFNPIISVPVLSAAVFAASYFVSFLLSKIPLAQKWVV